MPDISRLSLKVLELTILFSALFSALHLSSQLVLGLLVAFITISRPLIKFKGKQKSDAIFCVYVLTQQNSKTNGKDLFTKENCQKLFLWFFVQLRTHQNT